MGSQKLVILSLLQSVLGLVSELSAAEGRNSNLEATFVTSRGWCNSHDVCSFLDICGSIPEPFWGQRSCCSGALETIRACGDPQPCDSQYTEAIRRNCNRFCLPTCLPTEQVLRVTENADNEKHTKEAVCGDATVMTVLGICILFPFWGQKACCGNALETIKACGYAKPCDSKFASGINEKCDGVCSLGL